MTTQAVRPLHVIAAEIRADWVKVNYGAVPYLEAMASLTFFTDKYYADSGVEIVRYFLLNATSWRGDTARRVKAELKAMIR